MSDAADDHVSLDPAALESLLHDVPLEVTVELGRTRMNLSELAGRLGPGSIITGNCRSSAVNSIAAINSRNDSSRSVGGRKTCNFPSRTSTHKAVGMTDEASSKRVSTVTGLPPRSIAMSDTAGSSLFKSSAQANPSAMPFRYLPVPDAAPAYC